MSEAARKRLKAALPFLAVGGNMAKLQAPQGTVMLAIISQNPDGSGQISTTLEFEPLMNDLISLLGYDSMDALVADEDDDETDQEEPGTPDQT